jgi:hypothetical protein
MVALTIIMTSISSAVGLVQSSITASRIGGSQIIAGNLAREGMEVVRSLRDSNWLRGESFETGLIDASVKTGRPFFDRAQGLWTFQFTAAPMSPSDPLATLYLTQDGIYVHADAPSGNDLAAPYRRVVTLNHVCRHNATGVERVETGDTAVCLLGVETLAALDVISTVQWNGLTGRQRDTVAQERLYDWR